MKSVLVPSDATSTRPVRRHAPSKGPFSSAILNTAYRKDGKIARCEGKDYKVKFYSVYRPVAIAGTRNLPDTVEDRSLKVELVRKKRDEKVKKLQIDRIENELQKLRDDLHIFALENANQTKLRKHLGMS